MLDAWFLVLLLKTKIRHTLNASECVKLWNVCF